MKERRGYEKKLIYPFVGMLFCLLFISCNHQAKINNANAINREGNFVTKPYYSKDAKESFELFLTSPEENSVRAIYARAARLADDCNQEDYLEEEMYAEMWVNLTDEEKKLIVENIDDVKINFGLSIGVDVESSVGRAASEGLTTELDSLTEYYGLLEFLKEVGKGEEIPASLLDLEYAISGTSKLSVELVLEMLIRNEEWNELKKILTYIKQDDKFAEIRERWRKLNDAWSTEKRIERSASSSSSNYTTPLMENVGLKLSDGDVLLTNSRKKAYVIAGEWSHGGIFSKEEYELGGKNDSCFCVFTAEPEQNKDDESEYKDTDPDRWGFACLEPIYTYTKAMKFSALHPKKYSETKAKSAISDAKAIYYDAKAVYNLPWWELLGIGDTSHDLTKNNTYCTKVVYTAWKKNGVDLDSKTFAGNLVSPDDIYGSSIKRTVTLTISILGWKYKKTWVTYNPTTTVLVQKSR